ncbi:MAG: tetratricopeptide repeat protein [Candidatus Gastranaerophilaceae bacterium]
MAYNTMSVTSYKPYLITNNGGFVKKKEDEESSQSARSSQPDNEQTQVNQNGRKTIEQQLKESKDSHQLATASRDANLKNATINIAQIIKDFKNTSKAIGASPELTEEVNVYLSLVEKQVIKPNPDTKLVRSNLKNASSLLDNYISETLQRPSKVVENWIEALFLQQINYKFNEEEINPHFLVKFPNVKKEEDEDSDSSVEDCEGEEGEAKPSINVPKDARLKSLFLQAKKYAYANNSKKSMELFQEALKRAIEVSDSETESKILYEIGKIYDKNDYLVQALSSYHRSLTATQDLNVKTKAHYSMAQIYDDVAQFTPAIDHYMSSISYAGENENLTAQSTSLTKIGNIYSDEYKKEAFDFLLEAELIATESKNPKTKGYVSSNIANAYNRFNEPQNALKFYSNAVKEYQDVDDSQKVAINYKRAAEVMKDFNNHSKAKSLMQKALAKARQTDDVQLMKEIHESLGMI